MSITMNTNDTCSILGMYLFGGKFCKFTDDATGQERECTCPEIVSKHPLCECDRKHFNNFLWATVTVFQVRTETKHYQIPYVIFAVLMMNFIVSITSTLSSALVLRPKFATRSDNHNWLIFYKRPQGAWSRRSLAVLLYTCHMSSLYFPMSIW